MTTRQWWEKVHVTSALPPGSTVQVEMGKLQMTRNGRPVHLLGLEFRLAVQYDSAGGYGAALDGQYKRAAVANIVLQTGTHRWIDNLDGDEMHFLSQIRRQAFISGTGDPADIADGVAANQTFTDYAHYFACDPHANAPEAPFDGAIPLMLLDHTKGDNGLSFSIPSNFKGATAYTIDTVTVQVWALLCTMDHVNVPTPHQMRAYTETEVDFRLKPRGRIFSAFIRDTTNAAGAVRAPDAAGYSGMNLTIDDETVAIGFTADNFVRNHNALCPPGHSQIDTGTGLPIVWARARTKRSKMVSGTVRLEITTRLDASAGAARNNSRVLLHESGRMTATWLAAAHRVLGIPYQEGSSGVQPRYAKKQGPPGLAQFLDSALYWPGMSAKNLAVPAKKLESKARAARR